MMTEKQRELLEEADRVGFSHTGLCDVRTLKALPEVRSMCANDKCHMYGVTWTCPPGCGTVEECEARMQSYDWGILVQTTQNLEDSMDFEGMMAGEHLQGERCQELLKIVHQKYPKALCLFHGPCQICKKCTYPEAPCRFPDKAVSAMEGYGLLVSQVCKDNDMKYYYGRDTVTYTGLFLIKNLAENSD